MPELDPDLTKTLSMCVFAVAKGKQTCSAESGHLASARLMFKGTRQMTIVDLEAVWNHLDSKLELPDVSLKKVYSWIKKATLDNFKSFISDVPKEQPPVYHTTVGTHDVLHILPGFVFLEQIGNVDSVGIRYIHASLAHLDSLQSINRRLLAANAENELLVQVVDKLIALS